MIKKISTKIEGLYILKKISHKDNRGLFKELWNKHIMNDLQLKCSFDQDNISISKLKDSDNKLLIAVTEKRTKEDIDKLVKFLKNQ